MATLTLSPNVSVKVAPGKLLTIDNSLEFAGTDGTKFTFPSVSDTVACLGTINPFTAPQSIAINSNTQYAFSVSNNGLTNGGGGAPINVAKITSSSITGNSSILMLEHDTSNFSSVGAALYLNMANGSGTFGADFIYAANAGALKFSVDSTGTGYFANQLKANTVLINGTFLLQDVTAPNGTVSGTATLGKIPAGQATTASTTWMVMQLGATAYRWPIWLNT